ncbi:EAL domain-containing protein, partial [Pseudomonas gingeri]|uniref:EAL domain-containing protein n=2 Tax=Pseudomonas TaxID=286 RepID=UPI0015A26338
RLFIKKILTSNKHLIAVENTVTMAKSMGIHVVAEGVENKEQLLLLQSLGCDFAQGFLFSPPIPQAYIENWYNRWNGAILL